MRQIVLDTETTGLETAQGHRIIEMGCVELHNRRLTGRHYHQYIRPERDIDAGAIEIHGITNEFLADKPLFEDIAAEFLDFVSDAELIIHNAPFDVGFINHEFKLLADNRFRAIDHYCTIVDTLVIARQKHPGQKNNLDALCKRYGIDNSQRNLHGALLDAEILADVYLAMTGGQIDLALDHDRSDGRFGSDGALQLPLQRLAQTLPTPIIYADEQALAEHRRKLEKIDALSNGGCLWLNLKESESVASTADAESTEPKAMDQPH